MSLESLQTQGPSVYVDGSPVPDSGKPAPRIDRLTARLACAQKPGALCPADKTSGPGQSRDVPPDPLPGAGGQAPQSEPLGGTYGCCACRAPVNCCGSVREPLHGAGFFVKSRKVLEHHSTDGKPGVGAPRRQSTPGSLLLPCLCGGPGGPRPLPPPLLLGDPRRPPPLPPSGARHRRGPGVTPLSSGHFPLCSVCERCLLCG